ncbi:hypothetical protein J2Z60_001892 [Lactobacillus colini]|uniref:ATP-grasp domain-containing protein n=1 Tax=Lactobacillus colini TaxID=1819254 RepID=A0ABS4MG88_9LACO|nr:ATP-grasp domain-containing protein [Lactobacillus colini]MBP2058703.1 hypothetical protein [Lactobacillus colini]
MKNFILDVNTPVMIDALKSLGYVYKVKPGKEFSEIKRDGYSEISFPRHDFEKMTNILNFFKSRELSAVVSFNEDTRKFWFEFAKKLGVNTNLKKVYVENQNKINARQKVNSITDNKVKWYTVDDFIQMGPEKQKFPVIVKPRIGKGSMKVHKCNNLDELMAFLSDEDYSKFFIENFINGEEFSIEAMHIAGKHIIYGVTSKIKYDGTVVEAGHISNKVQLTPTQHDELINIYNVLGYSNIVSHTEVMIKPDGSLFYIESHPRLGGDLIPTLTLPEFDVDFYQLVMKIATGHHPDVKLKPQMTSRFALFPEPKIYPAKFKYSQEDLDYLKTKFGCYLVIPSFPSNQEILNAPSSSYDRPLALACEVSSVSDINKTINSILSYCNEKLFDTK